MKFPLKTLSPSLALAATLALILTGFPVALPTAEASVAPFAEQFEATFRLSQNLDAPDLAIQLNEQSAIISSNAGVIATCTTRSLESNLEGKPISMEMNCRSTGLNALSTTTLLTWTNPSRTSAHIRFGTWIQGYQEAALEVRVDHFMTAHTIAKKD